MALYKTPDVYVEEISVFPPSVAEVETAIPAFIGYTEKATKITDDDLHMKPIRIKSMLEFEQYFGYGPAPVIDGVYLDDSGNFKSAEVTTSYYMYDSMRLFYDNGGGDCYIVSVGKYVTNPVSETDIKAGLDAVYNYDEPTILLFPDAATLTDSALGNIQKKALIQCAELMDRVAVFDTLVGDRNGDSFRNNVGMNNLKYGMAYAPWLNVSLTKNITYNDFKDKIFRNGSSTQISLQLFTTTAEIKTLISDYNALIADQLTITSDNTLMLGAGKTLRQKFNELVNTYETLRNEANLEAVFNLFYKAAAKVDKWSHFLPDLTKMKNEDLATATTGYISSDLREIYETLIGYNRALAVEVATFDESLDGNSEATITNVAWESAPGDNIFDAAVVGSDTAFEGVLNGLPTDLDRFNTTLGKLKELFESVYPVYNAILGTSSGMEKTYESNLIDSYPLYKTILRGLNDSSTVMPPSGAIAGVYASTDRDRGVWKAPANVSLNSVLGPYNIYSASELDALNIDVNAGKSINAIRTFAGKGTLVWGARTLAGNDNEWRYVPVRRFYVNVEESIKKSTYWAVFEPNNANTWIRVKGMIESYLTNKWKEGALVGAKPDEAFFVRIGIGSTMTPDDVLNGYMKVEIGMAVVRPAEFIVLKFSHKLQQA